MKENDLPAAGGDAFDEWDAATRAKGTAQAKALRDQAREGGLRFETYLPPRLAEWLIGLVEAGVYRDPGEAAFVMLTEHRELAPHAALRCELLRRTIQASVDDPRPSIPAEEVFKALREKFGQPRPEPAEWKRS